jgi:hypothetical protein
LDTGDVDDHEGLDGFHWIIAARAREMTQLNDEAQVLERPPLEKPPVPFLSVRRQFFFFLAATNHDVPGSSGSIAPRGVL